MAVEQISKRHDSAGVKRWLKRQGRGLMRRLGRRLLQDAPRRLPTNGWAL